MTIKQAIIVPRNVRMSPGKLAAQVAHAAVGAVAHTHPKVLAQWSELGVTKVVLQVPDETHLWPLLQQAAAEGLPCYLVADAGRTEIPTGSITALAIGPGEIDHITGQLPLYR